MKFEIRKKWFLIKCHFKRWYSNILHRPLYTKEQKALFDQLRPGDLVYARMPLSDEEMYHIPEGHQNRPYLIVQKKENMLVVYPASHKAPKHINCMNCFVMKKEVYRKYNWQNEIRINMQNSYFDLSKPYVLPIENLHFCSSRLTAQDFQEVGRKLEIAKNNGVDVAGLDTHLVIREGDICKVQGALWYVYRRYKGTLYVHPVYSQQMSIEMMSLCFNGSTYYLNLFSCKNLSDMGDFPVIWACDQSVIALIESRKKSIHYQTKRERRKEKAKNEVRYRLRYPMGQQFYFQFNETIVIYLYHIRDQAYGIYLDEFKDGIFQIRNIHDFEYLRQGEMIDCMQLNHIKKTLVKARRDTHHVLTHVLNQENQMKASTFLC